MLERINNRKAVYLGPVGTFTHIAGLSLGYARDELVAAKTITAVCEQVAGREYHRGIIPIENLEVGSVKLTLEALARLSVKIRREMVTPIEHTLYFRPDAKIEQIMSKPEAIGQCRRFWERCFPLFDSSNFIDTDSTSAAVLVAAENPRVAAVGSKIAAKELGLEGVLLSTPNIEDSRTNVTRFVEVTATDEEGLMITGDDKTSVIINLQDKPGSLLHFLDGLAEHGINLAKIRSFNRIDGGVSMFLTVEGHQAISPLKEQLTSLRAKLLGSYPRAEYTAPESLGDIDITDAIGRVKKETVNGSKGDPEEAVVVFTLEDKPGALREALALFSEVNLTAINSLPTRRKLGEYIFYLGCDKGAFYRAAIAGKLTGLCEYSYLLNNGDTYNLRDVHDVY